MTEHTESPDCGCGCRIPRTHIDRVCDVCSHKCEAVFCIAERCACCTGFLLVNEDSDLTTNEIIQKLLTSEDLECSRSEIYNPLKFCVKDLIEQLHVSKILQG